MTSELQPLSLMRLNMNSLPNRLILGSETSSAKKLGPKKRPRLEMRRLTMHMMMSKRRRPV